ncbi:MAG: carboxylesterase family protein [Dehalococcoidales bacterium]|nr:carboxylesterase family protein [Dehalococcoidales bacterium]
MNPESKAIVNTQAGKIEGYQERGMFIFKGVPYAEPPVGALRWFPPQPVKPWQGVRPAQKFGLSAPQNPMPGVFSSIEPQHQSEDCLYLNIWTPGLDNTLRPVFIWIHGGGFTTGGSELPVYDGSKLAARGNMVVVTINYRLGIFGFMSLNETTKGRIPCTGNQAILDQQAAMKWVKDNIEAFGGDPTNVTIAGESAGGRSVYAHLASPTARGLFHKAIVQSSAACKLEMPQNAAQEGEEILEALGVKNADIDAIRKITTAQLLAIQKKKMANPKKSTSMRPVRDGKVFIDDPLRSIIDGSAWSIPVLIGSTLEETRVRVALNPEQKLEKMDEAGLLKGCQAIMPSEKIDIIKTLIEAYRKARTKRGEPTTPYDLLAVIESDQMFRLPVIKISDLAHEREQTVFSYLFTWKSPLPYVGAAHGVDVGFVFGTNDASYSGSGITADELSRKIQDGWSAFARKSNPSCESLGEWRHYGDLRRTMAFGEKCYMEEDPYAEERFAWLSISEINQVPRWLL